MTDANHIDKPMVLVVDDTPDNLSLMSELLKDLYRLKLALTGTRPDIILLDIMMPIMDGYET